MNKKKSIILSVSLLAAVVAIIAIVAPIVKFKKQQNQNYKKTLDKLRFDFANAQKELQELINLKDGKSVDTTKAALVLKNTKITNSSTISQVSQAVQTINKATNELREVINNKKQQEFNEFNKIKQELTDYIANDLKDLEYKDIKAKAQKSIEKVSDINSNSYISDIQEATKLLIDAKKQAISEVEKIKSNKLDKYKIAKSELELLINDDDAKEFETEDVSKALNNKVNKNSTLKEIAYATKALEEAKSKLDQEIKDKKQKLMANLEKKNEKLDALLKTKNLNDLMFISKRPDNLKSDEMKNKLEEAEKLSEEAKKPSKNLKIANINQKIQKIDEFVGKLESWIEVMKKEKTDIAYAIASRTKGMNLIETDSIYSVFFSNLRKILEKTIFKNPYSIEKIIDLNKTKKDVDILWNICLLYNKYEGNVNLPLILQAKIAEEFAKILDKETIPSDYEMTQFQNKLEEIKNNFH
ncbi:hypothetical protein [Ureaplasma parvum]|uniref:hypothetical protein n=1 Tax=Ureaplasma parvum TaxID=134821 RepID=UPI0026EA5755|nr:hypothetical protein [Ureaplasma parvum]